MGYTRVFLTAGLAFLVTGLRQDVSSIQNARPVMLTISGVLLLLALFTYGDSDPCVEEGSTRRKRAQAAKQQ